MTNEIQKNQMITAVLQKTLNYYYQSLFDAFHVLKQKFISIKTKMKSDGTADFYFVYQTENGETVTKKTEIGNILYNLNKNHEIINILQNPNQKIRNNNNWDVIISFYLVHIKTKNPYITDWGKSLLTAYGL